jgi:hypothetical protein
MHVEVVSGTSAPSIASFPEQVTATGCEEFINQ